MKKKKKRLKITRMTRAQREDVPTWSHEFDEEEPPKPRSLPKRSWKLSIGNHAEQNWSDL